MAIPAGNGILAKTLLYKDLRHSLAPLSLTAAGGDGIILIDYVSRIRGADGANAMGLAIGNISDPLQTRRIEASPDSIGRPPEDTAPSSETGFRGDEDRVRAGFGENTISIPAITAHTVDRSFEEARKMVPTLEELRQEQQARAEERRAEALDRLDARRETPGKNTQEPMIRIDFQRAESQARAQTRPAADSLSASAAQPGAGATAQGSGASVQAARQAFTFAPLAAARFDVRG